MAKSAGRRAYDLYSRLPNGVRRHTDKAIKLGARATKDLRNREAINRQGKKFTTSLRKKIRI